VQVYDSPASESDSDSSEELDIKGGNGGSGGKSGSDQKEKTGSAFAAHRKFSFAQDDAVDSIPVMKHGSSKRSKASASSSVSPVQIRKVTKIDPMPVHMEEFLSFTEGDETKFAVKVPANPEKEEEKEENAEGKISAKYNRSLKYPWLNDRTLRIKDLHLYLHSEILDFVEYVSPTKADIQLRQGVVRRIAKVVNKAYPEAKVLVFGSCATGLNLPNSDIDLLVYNPGKGGITMINKLTSELLRADICTSIEPIKHSKVPIIKL